MSFAALLLQAAGDVASVVPHLLSSGPLGIGCVVLGYWGHKKDEALTEERRARIHDAIEMRGLALTLQERGLATAQQLAHGADRIADAVEALRTLGTPKR